METTHEKVTKLSSFLSENTQTQYEDIVRPLYPKKNRALMIVTVILLGFGVVVLLSASMHTTSGSVLSYVLPQLRNSLIGVVGALFLLWYRDISRWNKSILVFGAYFVVLVLMLMTARFGIVEENARRWVELPGGLRFQSSEVAKLGLVFFLAGYHSSLRRFRISKRIKRDMMKSFQMQGKTSFTVEERKRLRDYSKVLVEEEMKKPVPRTSFRDHKFSDSMMEFVLPVFLCLTVLVLVLLQPHLSGFIILSALCLVCFLASGISIWSWIQGGVVVLLTLLIAGNFLMSGLSVEDKDKVLRNFNHVFVRIAGINDLKGKEALDNEMALQAADDGSDKETQGENGVEAEVKTGNEADGVASEKQVTSTVKADNYQADNSILAIASGGFSGLGLGASRQKYGYLPVANNDYIYAIACEELGFLGGTAIILLFLIFIGIGLYISARAEQGFCRTIALGYTILIGLQALLNIAVAVGSIPSTGVSLPFFSSGGTANAIFIFAVGMILAVSGTRRAETGKKVAR